MALFPIAMTIYSRDPVSYSRELVMVNHNFRLGTNFKKLPLVQEKS